MVDMSVGEYKIIDGHRIESEMPVHRIGVSAMTLKQAAIQQYFLSVAKRYQMFAAGNSPGCTME